MHGGSTTDPIFEASYLQAYAEAGEQARNFCFRCHAPGVYLVKSKEARELFKAEGITCDYCHSVVSVDLQKRNQPFTVKLDGIKALQIYLPSRFPSNVDCAANALGGTLGAAIGTLLSNHLLRDDGLQALRYRLFREGARIDLGLVLLGLWLLSLLYPGTSLFGNGDLRALLSEPGGELHPGEFFIRFEALVVGTSTVAVGLLLALLVGRNQPVRALFLALMATALAVRTLSYGLLFSSKNLFDWMTPGAALGLAAGVLIVLVMVKVARIFKVMLCGLALMTATALVNYAPENPYFLAALATWQQGHFLNFNGFTRVLSVAWPFAAVLYVLALAGSRSRDRD